MDENLRARPFAWDDVEQLHQLVSSRWTVDGPDGQRRIGDFWWALRGTPEGDPLRHMQVWPRADGSLTACAWLDPPDTGDVIVAPDAEIALDKALDWLEKEHRVAGGGSPAIAVLAGDHWRAAALRQRAFAPSEAGNVRLSKALEAAPAPVPLPDGFSLRGVSSDTDIERRVFVETASFGTRITAEEWRSLMQRLPGYRTDLDLIAIAPDGSGASACTCWYDEQTGCGEFEAVGTAKAYQRMGIGKAVITEGLRRLYGLGATRAIVETTIGNTAAIALYESCGFEVIAKDYSWMKTH